MPPVERDSAWITPKTWNTGDLLTATDLNEQIKTNMNDLKAPPGGYYRMDDSADWTTTSTSFVDVDATDLSTTFDCSGAGDLYVFFIGTVSGGTRIYFDVALDGTRQGLDDGIFGMETSANGRPASFFYKIPTPSAGSHTVKLQWKIASGTGTLYAGAGTASYDVHGMFEVREIG